MIWSITQTSNRCNKPARFIIVAQGNDLSLMRILLYWQSLPGCQSAGNCRSRESQRSQWADLLITICEAFDRLVTDVMHDLEAVCPPILLSLIKENGSQRHIGTDEQAGSMLWASLTFFTSAILQLYCSRPPPNHSPASLGCPLGLLLPPH